MASLDPISAVIQQLSKEAAQDASAKTDAGSYLAEANAEMLRARELEFSDSEKQWVRSHVWLKTAQDIAAFNKHKLRYLTLPAYYRLDVSLFDRQGILADGVNSAGQRMLDVAAFEKEPGKFARMSSQLPTFRLIGQCGVEDAITDNKNPYFKQLADMFPFDLVNMDLTSSLTPKKEGPYSTIMQALDQILRRQRDQIGRWSLFLTFRNVPPDWEPNAVDQLSTNLQENIGDHPEVRDAF